MRKTVGGLRPGSLAVNSWEVRKIEYWLCRQAIRIRPRTTKDQGHHRLRRRFRRPRAGQLPRVRRASPSPATHIGLSSQRGWIERFLLPASCSRIRRLSCRRRLLQHWIRIPSWTADRPASGLPLLTTQTLSRPMEFDSWMRRNRRKNKKWTEKEEEKKTENRKGRRLHHLRGTARHDVTTVQSPSGLQAHSTAGEASLERDTDNVLDADANDASLQRYKESLGLSGGKLERAGESPTTAAFPARDTSITDFSRNAFDLSVMEFGISAAGTRHQAKEGEATNCLASSPQAQAQDQKVGPFRRQCQKRSPRPSTFIPPSSFAVAGQELAFATGGTGPSADGRWPLPLDCWLVGIFR
ncbi:hypothetical protein GGR56DRAFT_533770 [Xylariaceae sp. FL0804]|nr:hypothetical protein GGR56DRAFT_533770 [Xylariaceae sp. FL0804]